MRRKPAESGGDTALASFFRAVATGDNPKISRALRTSPGFARARNRRGAEPLHAASAGVPGGRPWNPKKQAKTIHLLIDSGAEANCTDALGATPLHRAVRTRCAAAVRALLERGANPRARNASGSTPLHLAVQTTGRGGSGTSAARAEQATIIGLLIEHGARTSDTDGSGKTVAQRSRGASLPFIAHLGT